MEERITKGIWIPIEIWKDSNLSWNEKILLLEVDSFTSKGQDCYFSDDYIADFLGVSRNRANILVNSLIEKGYISKTRFDGRRRYLCSNISVTIDNSSPAQNANADIAETQEQVLPKHNTSISNNNISKIDNNRINKNNNISIPLPFTGAEFVSTWELLTQQPKWRKKSRAALEMSLKKLAGYTEREAVQMMQNTIANDWQGLFPLKAGDKAVQSQYDLLCRKVGNVHASVFRQGKEMGWTRDDVAQRCGESYAKEWDEFQDIIQAL